MPWSAVVYGFDKGPSGPPIHSHGFKGGGMLRGFRSYSSVIWGEGLMRASLVISNSRVIMILRLFQVFLMMGQNTGREAHMMDRFISMQDKTTGALPYQLGSKVGAVPAWLSTRLMRRKMEQMLTLIDKLGFVPIVLNFR